MTRQEYLPRAQRPVNREGHTREKHKVLKSHVKSLIHCLRNAPLYTGTGFGIGKMQMNEPGRHISRQ